MLNYRETNRPNTKRITAAIDTQYKEPVVVTRMGAAIASGPSAAIITVGNQFSLATFKKEFTKKKYGMKIKKAVDALSAINHNNRMHAPNLVKILHAYNAVNKELEQVGYSLRSHKYSEFFSVITAEERRKKRTSAAKLQRNSKILN